MYKESINRGFSLIELLVALSILAVVAAIVVPKYLSLQEKAGSTVADQMAKELNNTYANWKASGGLVGSAPRTSNILKLLTSAAGSPNKAFGSGSGLVQDAVTSNEIRISAPGDLLVTLAGINASTSLLIVQSGGYLYMYDKGADKFFVLPPSVTNGTWVQGGSCSVGLPEGFSYTSGYGLASPAVQYDYTVVAHANQKGTLYGYSNGYFGRCEYTCGSPGGNGSVPVDIRYYYCSQKQQ